MICFPNAKINIGLRIIEKRNDGYHNIETVFYPIHGLYDCLEFIESETLTFTNTGLHIDGAIDDNLCVKAWKILHSKYAIPPIHIHLHKCIPFGAGMGGGSADAAFLLTALNTYFKLNLANTTLETLALELGSDCPFFINNTPIFAEGRGEIFSPLSISLQKYWIVIANPNIHVSTALAYSGTKPTKRQTKLNQDFPENPKNWKGIIENDFEISVFEKYPAIQDLKQNMYEMGAIYAAMSGSGSTVFGIFEKQPSIPSDFLIIWQGELK